MPNNDNQPSGDGDGAGREIPKSLTALGSRHQTHPGLPFELPIRGNDNRPSNTGDLSIPLNTQPLPPGHPDVLEEATALQTAEHASDQVRKEHEMKRMMTEKTMVIEEKQYQVTEEKVMELDSDADLLGPYPPSQDIVMRRKLQPRRRWWVQYQPYEPYVPYNHTPKDENERTQILHGQAQKKAREALDDKLVDLTVPMVMLHLGEDPFSLPGWLLPAMHQHMEDATESIYQMAKLCSEGRRCKSQKTWEDSANGNEERPNYLTGAPWFFFGPLTDPENLRTAAKLSHITHVPPMRDALIKGYRAMMVDLPSTYRLTLPRDSNFFMREKGSYHVLSRGAPEDVIHGKLCDIDWVIAKRLLYYELAKPSMVQAYVKDDSDALQIIQSNVYLLSVKKPWESPGAMSDALGMSSSIRNYLMDHWSPP